MRIHLLIPEVRELLAEGAHQDLVSVLQEMHPTDAAGILSALTVPEIAQAPDQASKEALIHAKWGVDTARLRDTLNTLSNVGGYFPQFRALNESHCTTIVDFENGDVQERGLELSNFIDSVLDGSGPVLDASETSDAADRAKPLNLIYSLVDGLL